MRAAKQVPGWVWGVLVGMHLLLLSWALSQSTWAFPDSDRYQQAADNLRLHGELYARPWTGGSPQGQAVQEFTIRPPGYPLMVWALGRYMAWPGVLLVVQNLLSLLNIGLVLGWWARWRQARGDDWGLPLLLVMSFPAQFIYANAVMSELLLQTLVVAMMGAALLFIETRQRRYFIGVAVAAGAALLVKPVFYPLAFVLPIVGVVLAGRGRRPSLAVIGALPVLVAGAYMGWNEQRTGYFHFSSIAEINLVHYNVAGVLRQQEGPGAAERWVAGVLAEANAQPDFASRQRLLQGRATAVLQAHPGGYARQHLLGMAALFLDPGRFDVAQELRLAAPRGGGLLAQARAGGRLQAVSQLSWGLLAGLAVVLLANGARLVLAARGFWRLRKAGRLLRTGRWVALGLLLYVALLTGPLGAARFLVPVWPLLLGLALAGLPGGRDAGDISREAGGASG